MLGNNEYLTNSRELVRIEKEYLSNKLKEFDCFDVFPSVVNYLLIKMKKGCLSATELKRKLFDEGILIRDCSNFKGLNNRYFRIAVRTRKENSQLIAAMKRIL